jgi:hypothetical protein
LIFGICFVKLEISFSFPHLRYGKFTIVWVIPVFKKSCILKTASNITEFCASTVRDPMCGVGYIFLSPDFEKIPPTIHFSNNCFWSMKSPLKIEITDNTGIKYYSVKMGNFSISKELKSTPKKIVVDFKLPRKYRNYTDNKTLTIEVGDKSKWQFFAGNIVRKKYNVIIDNKRPVVNTLSHSYGIGRGGAALVIFRASDKFLRETFVIVNKIHKFIKTSIFYIIF